MNRWSKRFLVTVFTVMAASFVALGGQAAEKTVGTVCSGDSNAADWDTIAQCNSGVMTKAPLFVGTATSYTCNATNAGLMQWSGTAFKGCNGTTWVSIPSTVSYTPSAFSFTDQTGLALSAVATSNAVALTGWAAPAGGTMTLTATCGTGCTAIARNGVWGSTTVSGFVPSDTIAIKQTCSASMGTATTANVIVGGTTSATWTVTTASCSASLHGSQLFTAGGTFTPPSTACYPLAVKAVVVGGGSGGGGDGSGNGDSEGGGSGGYVTASSVSLPSASAVAVTVGAGGAIQQNGNASSFGAYLTAAGGTVHYATGAVSNGGSGGSGVGCYVNKSGGVNGANGSGGCNLSPGSGQGSPIVSSTTTVLGITFSSATFAAGAAGSGGGQCGDGAGGIYINGSSPSQLSGTSNSYGYCKSGTGYGAGGAGAFNYSGNAGTGSAGLSGFVYVEW